MEERLIDLESRLAYQDQAISELNDAITNQQETIMKLERLCASLSARMAALAEALPAPGGGDETPPHY